MGVFTKPETLDSSLEKSMPGKHVVKLYLNQVFIYRADRSIFIDQSISYGLPYDCIVSKRLHLW